MRTAAAIFLVILFAGCGSTSPEDEVRDVAMKATAALTSDHPERSCRYVTDHNRCVGAMVLVKGMDVAAITGLPDDWEDRIEAAPVRINGDTATIGDFNGDGKPGRYIKRDGQWLADNQ